MKIYHVTTSKAAPAIMGEGLKAGTCLCTGDLVDYYSEVIEDEGDVPVIVEMTLDDLTWAMQEETLQPDHASIAEPITTALGKSEEEIAEAWAGSDGKWQDSLEIVGSIRVMDTIPANILSCAPVAATPSGR